MKNSKRIQREFDKLGKSHPLSGFKCECDVVFFRSLLREGGIPADGGIYIDISTLDGDILGLISLNRTLPRNSFRFVEVKRITIKQAFRRALKALAKERG